jgi:hypothetical protein
MQLFDIVKSIFSVDQKLWNSIGKNDKARNFFMVNRIMSIQFPVQANQFNKIKISPVPVIDWWHDTLSHRFKKPPSEWIYAKTKKTSAEAKDSPKDLSQIEDFIRTKYEVSKRDLLDIKKFYPQKYYEWAEDLAKQIGLQK